MSEIQEPIIESNILFFTITFVQHYLFSNSELNEKYDAFT